MPSLESNLRSSPAPTCARLHTSSLDSLDLNWNQAGMHTKTVSPNRLSHSIPLPSGPSLQPAWAQIRDWPHPSSQNEPDNPKNMILYVFRSGSSLIPGRLDLSRLLPTYLLQWSTDSQQVFSGFSF
jgi:hypothetical protein